MSGLSFTSFLLEGMILMASLLPVSTLANTGRDTQTPTLELLEFLAEWETGEDEWAGPEQFEDDSFDQLYDDGTEIEDNE